MNMELFVIPTHRRCTDAIDSIIREMHIYSKKADIELALAILDNGDEATSRFNCDYLRTIKEDCGFKVYYINMSHMEMISRQIAQEVKIDEEEMVGLLIPKKIDYGKIFNLIYLVAIALHADKIHRRDSDCYFARNAKEEEYSVGEEIKYLGQKINLVIESEELDVVDEVFFKNYESIVIVGSNYVGNWNIDLHELVSKDADIAIKLLELCGIPKESIGEQISSNYSEKSIEMLTKKAVLKSSFNVPDAPECGNVSMYEIYKYIPNFIGENGIGFDYFTYFMGFLFKTPIVFHQKRIQHIHDKKRYKSIDLYNYWLGVIKMIDLDLLYTKFIQEGHPNKLMKDMSGIEAIVAVYEKEFPDVIESIVNDINEESRIAKFNSVVEDILLAVGIDKYTEVGRKLMENRSHILTTLTNDYKKSIRLQRLWKSITDSAGQLEYLTEDWKL